MTVIYLLVVCDHATHSLSNSRLSLQCFQIVLYPEKIWTKHDGQRRVRHLGVCHVLPHLIEKGTEVLEKVEVYWGQVLAVTPDLFDKVGRGQGPVFCCN